MTKRTWAQVAKRYKSALNELIDAIDATGVFEIEAGCEGQGPLVEACRTVRRPLPPNLREWLREGDEEYRRTVDAIGR